MPFLLFLEDGSKLLPLPGLDVYANKERLEKKYFTFIIDGFDPYFIINEGKVCAVRMVNTCTDKEKLSFRDLMGCIKLEFIEVNEYVRKYVGKEAVNDMISYERKKGGDKRKYEPCDQIKMKKDIYVITRFH